jgi:hypothetical protein
VIFFEKKIIWAILSKGNLFSSISFVDEKMNLGKGLKPKIFGL